MKLLDTLLHWLHLKDGVAQSASRREICTAAEQEIARARQVLASLNHDRPWERKG